MKKKMVKIRLFKDSGAYSGDVFVAVNGESYQIKRGVEVEVPDYIAKVLNESEHQAEVVAALNEMHQAQAEAKMNKLRG